MKSVLAAALVSSAVAVQLMAAPPLVSYKHDQGTGLARARCTKNAPVLGGGAFVETSAATPFRPVSLRQTYPISDLTGVLAFGSTAIGWQAASSDFNDIVASFSICAEKTLAKAVSVQYVSAQSVGVARAFCPTGSKVIGGGGFVETPPALPFQEEKLRQSYPISDATGVLAFGTTAIGWQTASSNFSDTVVAFAVCATPTLGSTLSVQYISSQGTGLARAFCTASTVVTGGGGFVESFAPVFTPVSLRQTYPISDPTGVIAHGNSAIGWQTASSDFKDVVGSIAICASN